MNGSSLDVCDLLPVRGVHYVARGTESPSRPPEGSDLIDAGPKLEPETRAAAGARWRTELALVLGWWAIYGIWLTGQNLVLSSALGAPLSFAEAAGRAFFGAAVWAAIALFVFQLVHRFRLDRKPHSVPILIHAIAGAAISLGEVTLTWRIGHATGWVFDPFIDLFMRAFPTNIVYYWLFVGVGHGLEYYRDWRRRETQNALLSRRLVQTELHLLKTQLHPHFLFNTLHAISALMHRDVKAADRMLARLSQLLRTALDYSGTQEVSLQEELEFLEPYLEIEQARLGDRLTIEIDVSPHVLDARVPHMILQPIVENSIRHGIAPRAAPGWVRIHARGRRDMLDIEVVDNGAGLAPGRSANGGLGLSNTRARLQQLYGEKFSFEPRNAAEGGFEVAISIPFRPTSVPQYEPEEEVA
jgi:two-component system, LytTR family, sensor kinase